MHPTDVSLLGLALDVAGAVLLARGFMLKALPEIYYESRTYLDGNVFLLKSGLLQRAEAWGGAILLITGFLLQILGSLQVLPANAARLIVGWSGLLALLATAAVEFCIAQYIASRIGRRQFYEYKLRNYTPGDAFPATTVEEKEALLRAGALYDLRPQAGEAAATFAARLTQRVDKLGTKHRGKVTKPGERAQTWE